MHDDVLCGSAPTDFCGIQRGNSPKLSHGGGAAAWVSDPADGAPAALPDGDTLRELIMTKEKELHDINEYRIVQLEALVRERDTALGDAHAKLVKLKDDFGYNLRLIEERDAELATYDTSFQAAKASLRDKEVQLSGRACSSPSARARTRRSRSGSASRRRSGRPS